MNNKFVIKRADYKGKGLNFGDPAVEVAVDIPIALKGDIYLEGELVISGEFNSDSLKKELDNCSETEILVIHPQHYSMHAFKKSFYIINKDCDDIEQEISNILDAFYVESIRGLGEHIFVYKCSPITVGADRKFIKCVLNENVYLKNSTGAFMLNEGIKKIGLSENSIDRLLDRRIYTQD